MIFYVKKITDPSEANFNFEPIFDVEHLDFVSLEYEEVLKYATNCEEQCILGGYDVEKSKKRK